MAGLGKNGQYYYSPDIKVWIYTAHQGILDVSEDVMSFTIKRQENAVSTATLYLSNAAFKYTPGSNTNHSLPPIINTMDSIIISLKRETYLQVFTGYITYSPILTLIPSPIELQASCTLYKTQMTYWDAGALEFQDLIPSLLFNYSGTGQFSEQFQAEDGGIGQGITNLLQKVCNWQSGIHIGKIPDKWVELASSLYSAEPQSSVQNINTVNNMLNNAGITTEAGVDNTTVNNAKTEFHPASWPGVLVKGANIGSTNVSVTSLDSKSFGKIEDFDYNVPRATAINHKYWCSLPWPYDNPSGSTLNSTEISLAKNFLAGSKGQAGTGLDPMASQVPARLLGFFNAANGAQITCFCFYSTKASGAYSGKIVLSPDAWAALNGTTSATANKVLSNITINGFVDSRSSYVTSGIKTKANTPTPKTPTKNNPTATATNASGGKVTPSQAAATGARALGFAKQLDQMWYNYGGNPAGNGQWIQPVATAWPNGNVENPKSYNGKTNPKAGATDCSGLVKWAYAQVGIKLERSTSTQWIAAQAGGYVLGNSATLQPGDLIYYNGSGTGDSQHVGPSTSKDIPDHVVMYAGNNQVFSASETGTRIKLSTYNTQYRYGATRPAGLQATLATTNNVANPNFNTSTTSPNTNTTATVLVGYPSAFITDQPVLSTIQTLAQTGLRHFQSGPDGSFLSYFPDFFGSFKTAPSMIIRDIEIVDLKIYHDDTQLYTNVAVSGDPLTLGQGVNLADWMVTPGLITAAQPATLNMLFGFPPTSTNSPFASQSAIDSFYARYGMRPFVDEEPQIRSKIMEFMFAWQDFMFLWAQQYSTQASFTFMPELYPGTLIVLADHNLQLYVQSVVHQGSRDGGFSTEATLTCPTRIKSYKYAKDGKTIIGVNETAPIDYGFPFDPKTFTY